MAVNTAWLDAQNSVLGSMLISPELVPMVIAETEPEDFSGACRTVYDTARNLFLADTPVDVVSLAGAMGQEYRQFLAELMEITPTASNIAHYIRLCREQRRNARLRELAQEMLQAETGQELRKLLEQMAAGLVERPGLRISTTEQLARGFMDGHTKKRSYLTWPIREFDGEIYAEPGDFIILGGRPSTGKSAFALQCAWHWAQTRKVGYFSLETSAEKLFDRLMSGVARIDMADIKRNTIPDDGWQRFAGATDRITRTRLEIIQAAGMTVADIRAKTIERQYDLILIDYLQLITATGENRTAQVTNISIGLHTMAQSMGVTVVALSQLARQNPQNGSLGMASLRESGQIEQDADVVMILSMDGDSKTRRILSIEKNKEGTCPAIKLDFEGRYQTFSKSRATSEVVDKYTHEGKKARRASRKGEQMTMLPDDTPVPFEEDDQ